MYFCVVAEGVSIRRGGGLSSGAATRCHQCQPEKQKTGDVVIHVQCRILRENTLKNTFA